MSKAPKGQICLDLEIPGVMLELGQALAPGAYRGHRSTDANPQAAEPLLERALEMARKDPIARDYVGLKRGAGEHDALRMKIIGYLGWQLLGCSSASTSFADVAQAVADHKLPPMRALLEARHEIGLMVAEKFFAC
jgi:hypothetical protein